MAKYQVIKGNTVLKEFDNDWDAAIFALNNDSDRPYTKINTNSKEASKTWTHFEYKEKL